MACSIRICRYHCLLLCLPSPLSFLTGCLPPPPLLCLSSLLCLCDTFVWRPHMVMIETPSPVQMAHLSHTCLPAAAVAKDCGSARGKHLLLTPSLGGSFVCQGTVTPDPATTSLPPTLPVNVTLDTPPGSPTPQPATSAQREEYGKINISNN